MDFVTTLPRSMKTHDMIWVIVDRMKKIAHFQSIQMTYRMEQFTALYIQEIARLHGVLISVISI